MATAHRAQQWWTGAVIYQIYVRSFADSDGDGTGDIPGVMQHLDYLAALGVDALWFTPWYVSPLADGGYDVADYRAIDPVFGTLGDAEVLIKEAAARGIRTIIDIVPNHVSDQHPWFQAALRAAPGSPERDRFWFRDGKGPGGGEMPTHWVSDFSGDTWTRTTQSNGEPGQWYLHLFSSRQPDLNWDNAQVRQEFIDVLRFWFDRGVAGIRIDSAALLVKDPALPEVPANPGPGGHPHVDRDELHDIYRSWRQVADSYEEPRMLVGEVWLPDTERFARYLRDDEMHSAFNFDFMSRPWDAAQLRESITNTLHYHSQVSAQPTWVLSNHDVTRPVTRYGRADTAFSFKTKRFGEPTDLAVGRRRARAAALLSAALPGCLYIYQGDELGLPEVEDLPLGALQDPMYFRSGGVDPGRDGCRVPLPWTNEPPTYGFSPQGTAAVTWLPQPVGWGDYAAQVQEHDAASMLALYRKAVALRGSHDALHHGDFHWVPDMDPAVLAFTRTVPGSHPVCCMVNFGSSPAQLPEHRSVLLASGPLSGGTLPTDTAVWLEIETPAVTP